MLVLRNDQTASGDQSFAAVSAPDRRRPDEPACDLIGVGFGPANLALAVALEEIPTQLPSVTARFIEQQASFSWQPGMLLAESRMQSVFLEDLVSNRNPQSRFSFTNYLKEHGRLVEFLNLRDFYPTRREFNDYLRWAAGHFSGQVVYSQHVMDIEPILESGKTTQLRIAVKDTRSASEAAYLARNLIVATGRLPFIPAGVETRQGNAILHSSEFAHRVPHRFPNRDAKYHFLIVGSGQSAADILYFLLREYPNAEISIVFRQFAFRRMDDSCFLNELFHPDLVSFIYELPKHKRSVFNETYDRTNYSVVDDRLLAAIYRLLYEERVLGRNRTNILGFCELLGARESSSGGARAEVLRLMSDEVITMNIDAVVLATGFTKPATHPLLASVDRYLMRDTQGKYQIGRDYRVLTTPDFVPAIFLQGGSEHTHGHGDAAIPLVSTRAAVIVASLSQASTEGGRLTHNAETIFG
jgi:L-ornithine N5-oxygenase